MTFADLLSDAFLLWLSRWLWRTGKAESSIRRAGRRDIRKLTDSTEGTA